MPRNRRTRLITVLVALCSLLFMQLAVAAYACPGRVMDNTQVAQMATTSEASMPCAESMAMSVVVDQEQPHLCQAHCKAAQQSADKYQVPVPLAIEHLPSDFSVAVVLAADLASPPLSAYLPRTIPPPVAIRNCCFRI